MLYRLVSRYQCFRETYLPQHEGFRHHISPKRWNEPKRPHIVTTQGNNDIFTTMRTLNLKHTIVFISFINNYYTLRYGFNKGCGPFQNFQAINKVM
jgi:hypothetical protein